MSKLSSQVRGALKRSGFTVATKAEWLSPARHGKDVSIVTSVKNDSAVFLNTHLIAVPAGNEYVSAMLSGKTSDFAAKVAEKLVSQGFRAYTPIKIHKDINGQGFVSRPDAGFYVEAA